MPKSSLLAFALTLLPWLSFAAPAPAKTPAAAPSYCKAPEFRRFDFWLGDWDTYRIKDGKPGDVSVARNRVTSILDGCALHEEYRRDDGYTGESYTIYDASRKVWHQSWVTNQGELAVMEGIRHGDRIVLTGSITDDQGVQLQRVSWEPVKGGVRETCVGSRDGGKTWSPVFDIMFRPHKP